MRARRYELRSRIAIDAPVDRVFTVATDPQNVPKYAGEIDRIEVLSRDASRSCDVRSFIRVWGVTIPFRYRYRYSAPNFYGGVQRGRALVRGYFTMRFRAAGPNTTEVEHAEGVVSRVPLLAAIAGWLWFNLLSPDGLDDELRKLKALVESPASGALTPPPPPVASACS